MPPDAVVVGSGPNGLAAALTLARQGLAVEVYEGAPSPGGGCRTEALTLPGFLHDVCSSVHPLAAVAPFFDSVDLSGAGVRFLHPDVAFAHPLDGGRAAALVRSVDETARGFGGDAGRYRRLFGPLVARSGAVTDAVLAPLRRVPGAPLTVARFGVHAVLPATALAAPFETEEARALLAGVAAHSMLPLTHPLSGGFGLLLALLGHAAGWPVVEGGSARLITALVDELERLGGRVHSGRWIESLYDVPAAPVVLLDLAPRQVVSLAGDRLAAGERRALTRFRYGPGVCKVDWALSGPVPWAAAACRRAGTVHVGGSLEEVARSEADANAGRHSECPFVLVVQPTVVDPSRAPNGQHTLWAYCHVPSGSTVDMTTRVERQIERFAPGFGDLVLARTTATAAETARRDPNYVGGDINGGRCTLRQTVFRPTIRWDPYRTSVPGLFLCSSSTPPGGGVHGMCGARAARSALRYLGAARR